MELPDFVRHIMVKKMNGSLQQMTEHLLAWQTEEMAAHQEEVAAHAAASLKQFEEEMKA
jgi:hypothetical protein